MASRPTITMGLGRSPLAVPVALASILLGIFLLVAANSTRDYLNLDDAQMVLGGTFLLVFFVIVLTSLSGNMQVCFQIAYIYFAIYLLLPGFNHASSNEYPFFSMSYSQEVRLDAAIIVCVFCCMLVVVQFFGALFGGRNVRFVIDEDVRIAPNFLFLVLFWLVLIVSLALFLSLAGLNFAFGSRWEKLELDAAAGTMVTALPRAIAAVGMAYAIAQARLMRPGAAIITIIMFIVPTLMILYPPAIPRSQLFGLLLICAFAMLNFSTIRARLGLTITFIFGAVVAMPIADMLTRGRQSLSDVYAADILTRYFKTGDFDGLQSLNNVVVFAQTTGFQYGRQLLGSLFFFVPRDVWNTKPEPTGILAARAVGYKFLNVSQPLPGEFYSDFGLWGVAIGGVITGIVFLRLDKWISQNWGRAPEAQLVAGAFVAYTIALFRGTLAAVIGPVALVAILCLLIKWWGFRRIPVYQVAPKNSFRADREAGD